MLAAATAGIMVIGPVIIGYIPVMVVGALIFLLGIELLQEALVDTWGKLSRLEYLTVRQTNSPSIGGLPNLNRWSSLLSLWALGTLWQEYWWASSLPA